MFNNVCELAAYKWGLEDVRTVAVCTIFEKMGEGQATVLYCYLCDGSEVRKEEDAPEVRKEEDAPHDEEWDDTDWEMGFDPYSGCYDFDC